MMKFGVNAESAVKIESQRTDNNKILLRPNLSANSPKKLAPATVMIY